MFTKYNFFEKCTDYSSKSGTKSILKQIKSGCPYLDLITPKRLKQEAQYF